MIDVTQTLVSGSARLFQSLAARLCHRHYLGQTCIPTQLATSIADFVRQNYPAYQQRISGCTKDCVAFLSPKKSQVMKIYPAITDEAGYHLDKGCGYRGASVHLLAYLAARDEECFLSMSRGAGLIHPVLSANTECLLRDHFFVSQASISTKLFGDTCISIPQVRGYHVVEAIPGVLNLLIAFQDYVGGNSDILASHRGNVWVKNRMMIPVAPFEVESDGARQGLVPYLRDKGLLLDVGSAASSNFILTGNLPSSSKNFYPARKSDMFALHYVDLILMNNGVVTSSWPKCTSAMDEVRKLIIETSAPDPRLTRNEFQSLVNC